MTTAAVEPRAGERAPLGALSTDHKAVAIRLGWLCGAFFLAGGVLALLVRSELAVPGMQIVSHQGYDQLFTMHGSTMVYLVVQPLAVALGVDLVPLQIGAANLIAPRAALFAVWILAGGGALMYLGFLTHDGAGSAGWTAFLPLSSDRFVQGSGMDMWIVGVALANLAVIILAAVVLLTILLRRAPGMTMLQALAVLAGRKS